MDNDPKRKPYQQKLFMLNGHETSYTRRKLEKFKDRTSATAVGWAHALNIKAPIQMGIATNFVASLIPGERRSEQKRIECLGGVAPTREGDAQLIRYSGGLDVIHQNARIESMRNIIVQTAYLPDPFEAARLTRVIVTHREHRGSSAEQLAGSIECEQAKSEGFRLEPLSASQIEPLQAKYGVTKAQLAYMEIRDLVKYGRQLAGWGFGYAEDPDARLFEGDGGVHLTWTLADLLRRLAEIRIELASGVLAPSGFSIKFHPPSSPAKPGAGDFDEVTGPA